MAVSRKSSSRSVSLPKLWVDSREPPKIKHTLIQSGIDVGDTTLDTGDFTWVSSTGIAVLVERKTTRDLLASFSGRQSNGKSRAVNQFARLALFQGERLLAIEGYPEVDWRGQIIREGKASSFTQIGVDHFLLSAQRAGIHVVWAIPDQFPHRIIQLMKYYEKESHLWQTPQTLETPATDDKAPSTTT